MLFKTVLTSLVSLALIHGGHALPQVTTALPFNIVNPQDPSASIGIVSGEIVGTGSAGTTFVLSAVTATFTIVENDSQFAVVESASRTGLNAVASVACGISAGVADCTDVDVFVESSTTATVTTTASGSVAFVTAVISTSSGGSSASANSSSSTSNSASAASATRSSSGSGNHLGGGFMAAVVSLVLGAAIMA